MTTGEILFDRKDSKLPEAILFDLDDTILSFEGVTDTAWHHVCSQYVEEKQTAFNADRLFDSICIARRWYWSDPERHKIGRLDIMNTRKRIVREALEKLNHHRIEDGDELAERYELQLEELICPFPNALQTLEELKAKGVRMALLTNGMAVKQRWKIKRFDLSKYFDVCLIEEEVGFGKPDIRVYQLALELLSLKAEQVWMVGDNLRWDVEAPQSLGIFSIWK